MHMNAMRKTLLVLLLFACCLSLSGCMLMGAMILGGDSDAVSKEEIYTYVAKNSEALGTFPYEAYQMNVNAGKSEAAVIAAVLGQDTIVKSVDRCDLDVLQFYCGGSGNATSSTYCGFYYSEKDIPCAFEFEQEAQLTQTSEGAYEWRSADQQRAFATERIEPKWFWYYQMWN